MEVDRKGDIRLIGRAMREGWNVDRQMVIAALSEVVENRNPKLLIDAAKLLMKADEIDMKREELQQRKLETDGDRRLQLLELAQRIPVGELVKLASDNGVVIDSAIVEHDGIGSGQDQEGEETGRAS